MRNLTRLAAAGAAVLTIYPWSAAAQFDGLSQTAVAVQAYEKSAGRCFYEPIVGRALDRLRDHYSETEPYRWRRALRETVDSDEMVRNAMEFALQGSPYTADPRVSGPPKPAVAPADRDCAASGLSVGSALPFAGPLIGFDPTLFAEANRLMEGKGRVRGDTLANVLSPTSPRSITTESTATPPVTIFTYTCQVDGKSLLLKIDDAKNTLNWRGKNYKIKVQEDCAKFGWRAERSDEIFDFCTATQGYADFKEGGKTIQCQQNR